MKTNRKSKAIDTVSFFLSAASNINLLLDLPRRAFSVSVLSPWLFVYFHLFCRFNFATNMGKQKNVSNKQQQHHLQQMFLHPEFGNYIKYCRLHKHYCSHKSASQQHCESTINFGPDYSFNHTIATLAGLNVVAVTITNMVATTIGLNAVVATNIIAATTLRPTRGAARALLQQQNAPEYYNQSYFLLNITISLHSKEGSRRLLQPLLIHLVKLDG